MEQETNKHKILLVEDNELYSQGLAYMLSEKNLEIQTVPSAEDAFNSLPEFCPDLILLDVILKPSLDGFAFLNIIKKDIHFAHIPVILISTSSQQDKLSYGLSLGASDFLIKPFKIDELILKINSLLQLRNDIIKHAIAAPVINQITSKDIHHKVIKEFALLVQDAISENQDLTIPEIVKTLNVSYAKLEEIVKKVFNLTPVTYILNKRLEKSELMLRNSNMAINDIALAAGFHSTSYFCTCYKKAFGITPLQSRKSK